MGRAGGDYLGRAVCSFYRDFASSGTGACTWTSDDSLGAWRRRGFVENSRWYGGLRLHAGGSDGSDIGIVGGCRVSDDEETQRHHGGQVFWRSGSMKRLILTFVAIACVGVYVVGQTTAPASGKRRAVKTGPPNGLFTPAIITGDLVFTSGQIGLDPKTGQFPEGGFEAQFQQVFKNLTGVLEASGSNVENIVKATVFLADMNDYNAMNELYRKQFKGDPPARTTVQVAKLPRDARIEIEAVAVLK